jgi:purine-binding chemotaxis protein CheW
MTPAHQYCTFYLDGLFFGVEVQRVQEVIRYQELTRVPLASRVVSGLINLRGQIVTAIDLRQRLGLSSRPSDKLPMNVVIRSDEGVVSLLVDEIGDVQEVDAASFEPAPHTLRGEARALIRGAHKLENKLLLVLDTERTIQIPDEREERSSEPSPPAVRQRNRHQPVSHD